MMYVCVCLFMPISQSLCTCIYASRCDPKFTFALANDNHTRWLACCLSFTSCSCTNIEVKFSQCILRDTEHRSLPNHRPSNKASTHRLQFVHGKSVHAGIAQGVAFVRVVTARGDVEVPASADLHLLHGRLGVVDDVFVLDCVHWLV